MSDHFSITISGRRVDFVDPDPASIDIGDIVHAGAVEARFSGHTRWEEYGFAYSVAQHCVHVADEVFEDQSSILDEELCGLLHDAAESYIRDLSTPIKRLCHDYRAVERRLLRAIFQRFDLPPEWADAMPQRVLAADNVMLATEARDLCHPEIRRYINIDGARSTPLVVWSPNEARTRYLERFNSLMLARASLRRPARAV